MLMAVCTYNLDVPRLAEQQCHTRAFRPTSHLLNEKFCQWGRGLYFLDSRVCDPHFGESSRLSRCQQAWGTQAQALLV